MDKTKKILVTGAGGFIGTYTIMQLIDAGYFVIAVSHNTKSGIRHAHMMTISADICSDEFAEYVISQITDISIIVHLAADILVPGNYATFEHNVKGTWNVITLANILQVDKVIYMSSIPVIGHPLYIPITEEHPVRPLTPYHMSKYVGEMFLDYFLDQKINKIVLRIASPIGVGMKKNTFLYTILTQCKNNNPITIYGNGKRVQNYIDVRDIVRAISLSLHYMSNGTYLIAGERSISNIDLARYCKAITKSKSEICFLEISDAESDIIWKLSGDLAANELLYKPKYTLEETIEWIYSSII